VTVYDLPHLNAALNATATLLLTAGYVFIRRKAAKAHAVCMVAATLVSAAFLTSYLFYHAQVGSVEFTGRGIARPIYFSILLTHVVLAATVPGLAGLALFRAARRQFTRHRRIVRWTLPVWLYVSVTGVVVYLMLYHLYPGRV